jgi:Txe/YoeB family toxin of Txe-Axe toxin-antitoxin module
MQKLKVFKADPFHVSFKTHPLHGSLEGFWSFSISYQYRILFSFLDNWKGSVHRNPSLTILNFNKNVSFQMIVLLDTLEDYDQGEHEDLWVCLCTEIG